MAQGNGGFVALTAAEASERLKAMLCSFICRHFLNTKRFVQAKDLSITVVSGIGQGHAGRYSKDQLLTVIRAMNPITKEESLELHHLVECIHVHKVAIQQIDERHRSQSAGVRPTA